MRIQGFVAPSWKRWRGWKNNEMKLRDMHLLVVLPSFEACE